MNNLFDPPSPELARRYHMETSHVKVSQSLVTELLLQNNVQSRTSILITAAFNVAAATVMIISIVYDAWRLSKRCSLSQPAMGRLGFLRKIHSAEVFPLVLSTAIVMQGVIFITVQGMGLQSLFLENCIQISRFIWPAVWIVGFVLLVFATEAVYRGLRKNRFAPRGRWNTPICWTIVVIMLALTSIAPIIRPRRDDRCLASLLLWASPWSDIAIVLTSSLIFLYIVLGLILTVQLVRTVKLEREERIAASRIVYYLALGVVVFSFALPFWVQSTYMTMDTMISSPMAATALNIFGIVNMFMHLLLRSNADNMAIRPLNSSWNKHRSWRLFGSTDLDTNMAQHITTPIGLERSNSRSRLTSNEKDEFGSDLEAGQRSIAQSDSSDRSEGRKVFPAFAQFPNAPIASRHTRKLSNYSLFPPAASRSKGNNTGLLNPNDDYTALLPPRPAFSRRHTRFSSDISSATVQIGLRLSNMATPGPQGANASTTSLTIPKSSRGTPTMQPSTPIHHAPHDSCSLDLPVRLDGMPESGRSSSRISEKLQSMLSARRYAKRRTASLSGSFRLNSPIYGDVERPSMEVVPPPPLSVAKGKKGMPNPKPGLSEPQNDQWPLPDGLLLLPNKKYEPTKSWI